MSFNVENLFVKSSDQEKVSEAVGHYWQSGSQKLQPDWGLPSSFEPILSNDRKRKIAVSPPGKGWVALVESKQVVDFALAKELSEQLDTTVLVIQLFEVTSQSGYALVRHGQVLESFFGENDDPLGSTREVLKKFEIPFDVILFRDVIQKSQEGWIWRQKQAES